ncbi:hypothetical protein RCL1_004056 [Eukaryota sp. TZLM3-RCL]
MSNFCQVNCHPMSPTGVIGSPKPLCKHQKRMASRTSLKVPPRVDSFRVLRTELQPTTPLEHRKVLCQRLQENFPSFSLPQILDSLIIYAYIELSLDANQPCLCGCKIIKVALVYSELRDVFKNVLIPIGIGCFRLHERLLSKTTWKHMQSASELFNDNISSQINRDIASSKKWDDDTLMSRTGDLIELIEKRNPGEFNSEFFFDLVESYENYRIRREYKNCSLSEKQRAVVERFYSSARKYWGPGLREYDRKKLLYFK